MANNLRFLMGYVKCGYQKRHFRHVRLNRMNPKLDAFGSRPLSSVIDAVVLQEAAIEPGRRNTPPGFTTQLAAFTQQHPAAENLWPFLGRSAMNGP
jgi:hypothetical protein